MIMKMGIFRNILLDHEDVASGKSFVLFHKDFEHNEIPRISNFCGKIFTSLS